MKQKARLLSILVIFLLALGVIPVEGILAQETEDPLIRIENLLSASAERGMFSGSVLIAQGEEILLSEGYGFAVRQWDIPNTADTRFRITNQTELFIATAIMMLQERGLLSIDDPICDYIDTCPEIWQNITIHHLLSHSAGIPFLLNDIADLEVALPVNTNRLLELLANEPLMSTPSEGFYYGSDYLILGQIINSVSDQSYKVFIRQNLIEPLALTDTGFDSHGDVVERLAEGYQNERRLSNYVHVNNLGAALGMYSTIEDLFHFHQALRNGQLVSSELWQAMSTSSVILDEDLSYGYGMFLGSIEGHSSIGDNWWGLGYSNARLYLLDQDITIIILTNFGELDPDLYNRSIIQILFVDG